MTQREPLQPVPFIVKVKKRGKYRLEPRILQADGRVYKPIGKTVVEEHDPLIIGRVHNAAQLVVQKKRVWYRRIWRALIAWLNSE